jgi:hypothetical protein
MEATLNEFEAEVVVLLATYELIDSIANKAMLDIGDGAKTQVGFKSHIHAKYFNLALVDLLSLTDKDGPVPQRTYLQGLSGICSDPSFGGESVAGLRNAVEEFRSWLTTEITIQGMWLPTINLNIDLRIQRIDALKIAGNICKHNVLRSVQTMRAFQKVLAANNVEIGLNQVLQTIEQLYEWLHSHKFVAQSNAIVEFINNIRWGIYDYLQPQYQRSMVRHADEVGYHYTYPEEVKDELARANYWELMNKVRQPPYFQRFEVPEFWKNRVDEF